MKIHIAIFTLIMSFASVNGQTSTNINEFSNHIKMLEGKKVKQKPSTYGTIRDYYADKSLSRFYNGKKKRRNIFLQKRLF